MSYFLQYYLNIRIQFFHGIKAEWLKVEVLKMNIATQLTFYGFVHSCRNARGSYCSTIEGHLNVCGCIHTSFNTKFHFALSLQWLKLNPDLLVHVCDHIFNFLKYTVPILPPSFIQKQAVYTFQFLHSGGRSLLPAFNLQLYSLSCICPQWKHAAIGLWKVTLNSILCKKT